MSLIKLVKLLQAWSIIKNMVIIFINIKYLKLAIFKLLFNFKEPFIIFIIMKVFEVLFKDYYLN